VTQQIIPTKAPYLQTSQWLREYFQIRNEKLYGEYKIENVRFAHDPNWRDHWVSVQYVGDGGRDLIKGIMQPYVWTVGYAENLIFWTWFDLLNKQPAYRPKSLPPKLAHA
jgi:hypothetical protein